ncbi:carboxylating nicotinate-nucleotide diphosphorylase [Helicobacter sp. MIT 05-5293]|uniref:carboxylating nicotinate-nucleotide diphosphorylase n=1 Tax=Helicobacter sp. MIT 05-5293 TaxID=1548149 RepID=UPI00051D9B1D|nr:carboxylating nicotinate-nucleotide diphosphorylase [Helicobacter sp. MIT 05-5293]TLD82158.1 carboxylating nicotinate-nucleotide diphosphorylase [Helicobacter sp. MIT 05-5293]
MNHYRIKMFLEQALQEDLGRGDLYELFATDRQTKAHIIAKDSGIFSGEQYMQILLESFSIQILSSKSDGEAFVKGDVLCVIEGSYIAILQIERVLLNILAHSSGIATLCSQYVSLLKHLPMPIKLLDTRKTRPLLRELEKYSVRNGGAFNHRFGLDDGLMLKDTHLKHISNLQEIISKARSRLPFMSQIEVECENLEQVKEAINAGADIVMCDNMTPSEVKEVVQYRNLHAPHILLEASGNITLANIVDYAHTGVDAISVGALIHQAQWVDISMKIL